MPVNIVNTEQFTELRQSYGYYVDKTGFLLQFLKDPTDAARFRSPSSVSLITRPRRFGKTLFLSMLASFFDVTKSSRDLFTGLKVAENEALCKEWMNKYPVVSLTLKGIDAANFELALSDIQLLIREFCSQHKYLLLSERVTQEDKDDIQMFLQRKADISLLGLALRTLTRTLSCYYDKPVILLIDEYDVPVAKAAERGYYDEMILFMRVFLSNALKTNPYLKCGILTGALRITKESIFTGLNNLDCFDIVNPSYADVFGFTQCEVDQLLADAGLEEKRDALREWYDGYHFGDRSDIYCPWSIMKYLADVQRVPKAKPQAYWVGTSGNELTKGFRGHVPASIQDDMVLLAEGKSIAASINPALNYNQVYAKKDNFWTLLYLTGYLTPSSDSADCVVAPGPGQTVLAIPNREVREAFESEIKAWFDDIAPEDDLLDDFFQPFWDGDATKFEQELHERLLLSSSFRDYRYREYFYHSLLLGIFMLKYTVTSNREAGNGVFDLTVVNNDKNIAAVIEVKRADSEKELEACVEKALLQIEERQYDAELASKGYATILHWGMAFFRKTCKMGVRRA